MTSRPAPSKRPSVASAEVPPKPPCKVHSLAIISDKAQITGTHPFEIGENTILHPYAKIHTFGGKVVIGKNCTVSETAVIGFAEGAGSDEEVMVGDEVNIESGAVVEGKSVGHGTVIDVRAKIGKGAIIGKYCTIAPLCEIKAGEELADYTVVYGENQRRLNQTLAMNPEIREAKQKGQAMHVELLKKLIPDASAKWRS